LLGDEGHRLGRLSRVVRGGGRRLQRQGGASRGGGAASACRVGDDCQEPGPQRGATAESVERTVGTDEPLLGRILRFFSRPQDGVGEAEGNVLVAAHELLVGADVSAPGAFD
jgi:hypothetical protein